MTFSIHGLAVARGIAIGRVVLVASSRVDVAHYFIQPEQVSSEIKRLAFARDAVVKEVQGIQQNMPKDDNDKLSSFFSARVLFLFLLLQRSSSCSEQRR